MPQYQLLFEILHTGQFREKSFLHRPTRSKLARVSMIALAGT